MPVDNNLQESPDSTEIEASEPEVTEVEENVEESVGEGESQEAPEWEPQTKFKVMDKEFEMDEFIRPVLNKDNYDAVKSLYEKAYGLDFVKQKYQTVKEDFEKFKTNDYGQIKQNLGQYEEAFSFLGQTLQNKDYQTLFNQLQIPKDEILKVALDYVNYQNLPPDQKLEYDRNIEAKQRLYDVEKQNQFYRQQYEQAVVYSKQAELNQVLASPEVSEIARQYDAGTKPGAFIEQVRKEGTLAWQMGQDIPVSEAVSRALQYIPKPTAASTPQTMPSKPATPKPAMMKIQSTGNSMVKKPITSIDGMRKRREMLELNEE